MADLTTLANVKAYLGITASAPASDANIARLIRVESRTIEAYCSRTFSGLNTHIARRFNGSGSQTLFLPDTPILAIQLLTVDGVTIPLSPDGQAPGYFLDSEDASAIYLAGFCFTRGRQNVVVSWTAGWEATETDVIPSGNMPTLAPTTGGLPVMVKAVTDAASGTAFIPTTSNAPATGQYAFAAGVFSFASADAARSVLMDYYYVPMPVEQACVEAVGLDMKARDNLGVTSKTLAGESISYSGGGMTQSLKDMLWPFKRVVPA